MNSATLWGSWELWGILLLVSLATYVWRAAGATIAAHIDPNGDLVQWFSCLAYGMLAGLISRIVLLPVGILNETPLSDRLAALLVGFAIFFVLKRRTVPSLVASIATFGVLTALRDFGVL
ncbi:MAG: AzlD domain-containing protein [Rhodospirillales bacterium]|nr:AzlD domain-containing protein [Rhodospirillales bacterium]